MEGLGLYVIAAVVIPFVVQLLKKLPFVGKRYAPVVAFLCGLAVGVIDYFIPGGIEGLMPNILAGIAVGGTSTGLYDVAKHTVAGK